MKLATKCIWATVIVLAFISVGYSFFNRSTAKLPKDYTLPNDNFDEVTLQQIQADFEQYHANQNTTDHEIYKVTGGIGTANPRIMAWDPSGNMDFGLNDPPGTIFEIQEFGQDPMTWKQAIPHGKLDPKTKKGVTFTYRPLHWIKHVTQTGQVYYKLDDSTQAPQYFFQKGNTYIVVITFPNDTFPVGLMSHLVSIGNPVKRKAS